MFFFIIDAKKTLFGNQFGAISSSSNRFENFTPFSPTAKTAGDTQTGVMTKSDGHSLISLVELKKVTILRPLLIFFSVQKWKNDFWKLPFSAGKRGTAGPLFRFLLAHTRATKTWMIHENRPKGVRAALRQSPNSNRGYIWPKIQMWSPLTGHWKSLFCLNYKKTILWTVCTYNLEYEWTIFVKKSFFH